MQCHTVMVLDPEHFHASLLLKWPNPRLNEDVYVFAPDGSGLDQFLNMVESFNRRELNPTAWRLHVLRCEDSLEQLLRDHPGDLAILAGKNDDKSKKIAALTQAGINVLGDKPLVIDRPGLNSLQEALNSDVIVADLMTARQEACLQVQRELTTIPAVFGGFDLSDAISIESTHCLSKQVAGQRLVRPPWYFDVRRQGLGIVDVSTHYVDLTFLLLAGPTVPVRTELLAASIWPTLVPPEEFQTVTGVEPWPECLRGAVKNRILRLNANGEILFRCQDLSVRLRIEWRLREAPGIVEGINFVCRGNHAIVAVLRQPGGGSKLTVNPTREEERTELANALTQWAAPQPGLKLEPFGNGWQIILPPEKVKSHEEQFGVTLNRYLDRIDGHDTAEWEKNFLAAKYALLINAAEMAETSSR